MSATGNSKVRTLERAVVAFGAAQHLASYFDVELTRLEDWIAGRVEIPPEVFAAALDVVAAGPFAAWRGNPDATFAERHQAHADHLKEIAQRIKESAERAQRIADRAQRNADRSSALAQVQRALVSAIREQTSDHASEPSSDKLVEGSGTGK